MQHEHLEHQNVANTMENEKFVEVVTSVQNPANNKENQQNTWLQLLRCMFSLWTLDSEDVLGFWGIGILRSFKHTVKPKQFGTLILIVLLLCPTCI